MSKANKYLGPTGLTELINLIQADFQKKQDWTQFTEMPDATLYSGKVVQYTGISNNIYTKGHFYYSNGLAWVYIAICDAVEVCAVLPSWDEASAGLIYYVTSESACYIKGSETDEWLNIAGGESTSFEIVDELPAWEAADPKIIYMVPTASSSTITESDDGLSIVDGDLADGSVVGKPGLVVGDDSSETDDTTGTKDLTVIGYIKDAATPGKFYQLGSTAETAFEIVDELPDFASASADKIYFLRDNYKLFGYIKNEDIEDWCDLSSLGTFDLVSALPSYASADPNVLYLVIDGTKITGYVKNVNVSGEFYVLGEAVEPDPAFELVSTLPSYASADPNVLYLVIDGTKITGYVKNVNVSGEFYVLGEAVEPDPAFEVVDELPAYADADPDILYLVPDDTGILSVYKKDPDTTGEFFELSGSDAITTEDIDNIFEEVFN